jgi:Transglutaminase-like superfamily
MDDRPLRQRSRHGDLSDDDQHACHRKFCGTHTQRRRVACFRHRRFRYLLPLSIFCRSWRAGCSNIPPQLGACEIGRRRSNTEIPTDTLSLLKELNAYVSKRISYQSRDDEGAQSPTETPDRALGSCGIWRFFSLKQRVVSGSGKNCVGLTLRSRSEPRGSSGAGSTHTWAEVFAPGAGWITFDPTNRHVGGFNLIPVTVARGIRKPCR